MKKTMLVILIASTLCAATINMSLKSIASNGTENAFTRRIGGSYGYLQNAPTYYQPYVPQKWTCCKKKSCKIHHRKSKRYVESPRKCPKHRHRIRRDEKIATKEL